MGLAAPWRPSRPRCIQRAAGWQRAIVASAEPLEADGGATVLASWPLKSSLYLLRSDGMSCTREVVEGAPAHDGVCSAMLLPQRSPGQSASQLSACAAAGADALARARACSCACG